MDKYEYQEMLGEGMTKQAQINEIAEMILDKHVLVQINTLVHELTIAFPHYFKGDTPCDELLKDLLDVRALKDEYDGLSQDELEALVDDEEHELEDIDEAYEEHYREPVQFYFVTPWLASRLQEMDQLVSFALDTPVWGFESWGTRLSHCWPLEGIAEDVLKERLNDKA